MTDQTIHATIDAAIDAIAAAEDQLRDARRALLQADYEARQQPSDEVTAEEVRGWISEAHETSVKAARKLAHAKLSEASQKPQEGIQQAQVEDRAPQSAGEVLKRWQSRPERRSPFDVHVAEVTASMDRDGPAVEPVEISPGVTIAPSGGGQWLTSSRHGCVHYSHELPRWRDVLVLQQGDQQIQVRRAQRQAEADRLSLIETVMGWLKGGR